MKTPEQIAREAYGQEPGDGWAVGSSEIVPMIVRAIEADRAQRIEANAREEISKADAERLKRAGIALGGANYREGVAVGEGPSDCDATWYLQERSRKRRADFIALVNELTAEANNDD